MNNRVYVFKVNTYTSNLIETCLKDDLFKIIRPGNTIVLKPNWVKESRLDKPEEWVQIITNPTIITAIIKKVVEALQDNGKIIITDGPETDADFGKILEHYPVEEWFSLCNSSNITLDIIDLRDDEWTKKDGVITKRTKLTGDPKGKVLVNIEGYLSEFHSKIKSKRGYYGADYNLKETNKAHDGFKNLYSVSRSVIECDVFINIPKLKTHKKAGITCCLKNLVGINTYKNYLPHYSEGGPKEKGDQFPRENINSKVEGPLFAVLKQSVLQNHVVARLFLPFKKIGKLTFGDTNKIIRSGNWYGNDTIWRTILDINKVLLYGKTDGILKEDNWIKTKNYIGIVDGVIAGEGNGPLFPDSINLGYIISGSNPVAIDSVAAFLMGFDPMKMPSIKHAFLIKHYPICNFKFDDIKIIFENREFAFNTLPFDFKKKCKPHYGWEGHIEWKD
jgi:uncharacterized protein (DUF362 family)